MSLRRGNWKHSSPYTVAIKKNSFSKCPYEEGTESEPNTHLLSTIVEFQQMSLRRGNWKLYSMAILYSIRQVSANVPTKRELKEQIQQVLLFGFCSFSKCPYEEGTESQCFFAQSFDLFLFQQMSLRRGNWKGPDSIRSPDHKLGFSKCPYEEGTERKHKCHTTSHCVKFQQMSLRRGNWKICRDYVSGRLC